MFFSLQTIALVASTGLLAAQGASAVALEEKSTSLCNQQNYGASGVPWNSNSSPGSFCSSKKPSNNRYWNQIPYSDGYDKVRCSGYNKNRYNVCGKGNTRTSLPKKCNPPHKFPWGYYNPKTSSAAPAKSSTSSAAPAKSSAAAPVASSSAAAVSSAASAAASSAAASPAASSADSSSAASSAAAVASSDAATPASASSSASPSPSAVDPLSYPVCETTYQVTYTNYTLVAPNGVWTGLTVGAATQDASYMTYTLATSVDDCLAACDQIEGCVFVNTYYDVNAQEAYLPKHTPGVLTCAMFSACVGTDKNDNWGGQDDPNDIEQSNGYCKSSACGAPA
ncbi:uncharacterized protein I303_100170 [Kwoniella dejecticola CBS 10117]|uniref:Apple domain-containing protein n=1 Tax=Kwoniella dejecticola CBS 10117 TaxID=1296121 RepID=A0A1A6AEA7_9TREE|nr:uncharacterized protein I303_00171 [Kwoniella dejecticola CBS 10117]OBR88358.1 hypothetical protein I303_00171 [Kwoniella dejecticola CBS 10117]